MTVTLVLTLMGALLLLGMPIGFAMGLSGVVGIYAVGGIDTLLGIVAVTPYRQSASWILIAIPLFVLMAEMLASSRITADLFAAMNRWVGHLPGGLAIAGVLAAAGLGAVSGSSTAATAALSKSVAPELLAAGYSRGLAIGTVASAGTLAIMIPPSVIMVIYGILTETSVGLLFVAGIVPGLLTVVAYAATIVIWARYVPQAAPRTERHGWPARFAALRGVWPMLVLFVLVIGGLYSGVVTVTESAALGATGAIVLAFWFLRGEGWGALKEALARTTATTAMIFTIIIGAHLFSYFMTLTGTPQALLAYVDALQIEHWVVFSVIILIYLLLGCFMDQLAILVLTLPIVFPMVLRFGYDPIWFGIVLTKTVEIGLITPPLGMNCFVASSVSKIPLSQVFRGVTPFIGAELVTIVVLISVPQIVLWVR
jgi:tripartite ATP-independent transporter DctM subunit